MPHTAPACTDPPASELAHSSPIALKLDPNPVMAGSEATLSVSSDGLPDNAVVGFGVSWQCWNGSQWSTMPYQVLRGGGTYEVEPGAMTTVPAGAWPIPRSDPIVIPKVAAGTYRIEDTAWADGTKILGFVIVLVE